MFELRDFLYLDTVRLYSFVSQIHGGLVSEISETIKRLGGVSAGINVGVPPFGGKIDASKGKEGERQQTIEMTDPAYFDVLYKYLKEKSEIRDVTALDLRGREKLTEGRFIEMSGIAKPPVVEYWIARIKQLVEFLDNNAKLFMQGQPKAKGGRASQRLTRQQLNLFKEMVRFLEDYIRISRKDPGKQYIYIAGGEQEYGVWCGLLPEFVTVPLEATLPAQVHIVGRVEKLLDEGDVYRIVDFSQFSQTSDMNKLLDALSGLGPLIGQTEIKETDLQAQYPDIFVTTIAVYR
jgi:hypothetical protein